MRLDYLSIFPDYLSPLQLSLPGKAVASGLLELHVHDLRDFTHDRHRTVDDTPYGGGAGMVMKPEPFGEALDALAVDGATVVVPTPSGRPLTQALAADLATRERLVFLCGRYEGIDQRVLDHVGTRAELVEVSLGDYVLNGGEVAALAVTEAVVRLLPGFMGNAASLEEESHTDGLLEYPVYTKPATWRGHEVPPVLLSGNHGAIAAWREERSRERTAERRPDLLHASALAGGEEGGWEIVPAVPADAPELLTLQLACWVTEALVNDDLAIPPLHEGLDDVLAGIAGWDTYVVRVAGRLVGSVRGRRDPEEPTTWEVGRLMAAPDLRGRGLGRALLAHVQAVAPGDVERYRLFTGARSEANLRRYKRDGFRVTETLDGRSGPVVLVKPVRRRGR
ncbi:tRNA (guanosine(37)-N1)-methyltransferase TrmD [Nocardioides sp. GY 10127]|uniref:tRNA (guanosine(37)-N1)-methyltransferase TrmD n=1 Tax=Nocardioides sp. GY 10127 TaxID=2569762 RepID=UPI0010A7E1B5|nr:tRNA (guanosine(37)-N1)-methyltransferase TrmD [Nocardioides sp. GY 10127]TIC80845.1 tRNA (guanosine(37)-N1)-methyltransferase TrmD [Nocardioides sp. GY 10127]